MNTVLAIFIAAAFLVGCGILIWWALRRRFLAEIRPPFDRRTWQGRWMSRRRSLAGRAFARFPTRPLPPEGEFEAQVLVYYEFLRGLFWSKTPIEFSVVVHRLGSRLTNDPDGAALPASTKRNGRIGFADDMSESGLVEFEATLDTENLEIIGDFRSPGFDELGTFSLRYKR